MDVNLKNFFIKASAIIIISQILAKLLNYIWIWYVARIGADVYGAITLLLGIVSIATTLTLSGIKKAMPIYLIESKNKNSKSLESIMRASTTIYILLNILIITLIIIFSPLLAQTLFHSYAFTSLIILSVLYILSNTLEAPISNYLAVIKHIKAASLRGVLFKAFIKTALLIFIALTPLSIYLYTTSLEIKTKIVFLTILVSQIASTISLATYFLKVGSLKYLIPYNIFKLTPQQKQTLKYIYFTSFPLAITGTIYVLNTYIDSWLISALLKDLSLVGYYASALTLASLISLIPQMTTKVITIITTELLTKKQFNQIKIFYEKITKYSLIVFGYVFALYVLYGQEILSLIFGKEYANAYYALAILGFGQLFFIISTYAARIPLSKKQMKFFAYTSAVALFANIILNVLLIPLYGINGAALSTTLTLIGLGIANIWKANKIIKIKYFSIAHLIAFTLAITIIYGLNKAYHLFKPYLSLTDALILLILSLVSYFGLLFVFRIITPKEIKYFIETIQQTSSKKF